MDKFRSPFFCFHHPLKTDGVVLGHVGPHDEYCVRVHEIRQSCGSAAAPETCAQTGHSGAVSYTGLVTDANHTQTRGKQLLDQIVFFIIESGTAQMRDCRCVHHGFAIFLFDEGPLS